MRASFCGRLLSGFGRSTVSWTLCIALCAPEISTAQQTPTPTGAQKYKLTVDKDASGRIRVTNGRVSSQAVVRVTDENDVPVPAIAVIFLIPQGSGRAFTDGGLSSTVTTDAEGVASGPYSAPVPVPKGNWFITATAKTPSGDQTVRIRIPHGGPPLVVKVGIVAGAAGAAAVAAKVATGGSNPPPPPPQPGTIGNPGTPVFAPAIASLRSGFLSAYLSGRRSSENQTLPNGEHGAREPTPCWSCRSPATADLLAAIHTTAVGKQFGPGSGFPGARLFQRQPIFTTLAASRVARFAATHFSLGRVTANDRSVTVPHSTRR